MTQKQSTKRCSIILGSYFYYHTTYKARTDGDLCRLKWHSTGCRAGHKNHSNTRHHQATPGLVWGINSDVDIIWITPPLYTEVHYTSQCSCCTIFTLFHCFFYYRSRNPQSLLVTSPALLCCFGTVFQVTFISHTTIIPCILLHFGNCTAAWVITEHGLEMDVFAICVCLPWISPGNGPCQPVPSRRCLQDRPGWAPWGAPAIYTIHTHHKGLIPLNPAQSPGTAVPFLPTSPWALWTPLCAQFVSSRTGVLKPPRFPLPHHSNFRHIGFETHALCCESFLIWGLQVTQLCAAASHLGDKWMHCSSAALSGEGPEAVEKRAKCRGGRRGWLLWPLITHTPGLTDSPRHESRRVFPSDYAPARWLQTLVWQNLTRAERIALEM